MARRSRKNRPNQPLAFRAASPSDSPQSAEAPFQPDSEYLAGYGMAYALLQQPLPPQRYDPLAPEVNFETYRQMLNDPEVCSDVRTLRDMSLSDGVQLSPAFEGKPVDEDSGQFTRAEEIAAFCGRNLAGLRKPLKTTLEGIVEAALVYGHKTAEIVWKFGDGEDKNRLVLDKLAQKDYRTLDFVVDAYWNLLGFTARQPSRSVTDGRQLIPREKFFHLPLHEEDEDPRGRSSVRSVYTAWTFKLLAWPEYKRWLDNCALPSVVGKTAPKQPGDVQRNANGTPTSPTKVLSPAEAMMNALLGLKNASVAVIPNGAEIDQLQVVGEGGGFEKAINVADSQISKGILYQTLATSEAQFGTRAQSETHMGVLDLLVWWLKGKIADAIAGDLVKPMIIYNFGQEALQFAPLVNLGDSERRDWGTDAAAASLIEPALTDTQWNVVTAQLGLPDPLPGEEPRRTVMAQAIADSQPEPAKPKPGARFRTQSRPFVTVKGKR